MLPAERGDCLWITYGEPKHLHHVIVDECHHVPAASYQAVVPRLRPELLVGLTATPERSDGKSLLHYLAQTRHGRAVFANRPFAFLGLPTARREGSRVWNEQEDRSGGLSATILTDEDRDRIVNESRD